MGGGVVMVSLVAKRTAGPGRDERPGATPQYTQYRSCRMLDGSVAEFRSQSGCMTATGLPRPRPPVPRKPMEAPAARPAAHRAKDGCGLHRDAGPRRSQDHRHPTLRRPARCPSEPQRPGTEPGTGCCSPRTVSQAPRREDRLVLPLRSCSPACRRLGLGAVPGRRCPCHQDAAHAPPCAGRKLSSRQPVPTWSARVRLRSP